MLLKKIFVSLILTGVMTLSTSINSQALETQLSYNETNMKKTISIDTNIGIEGLSYQKNGYIMLPLRLTCERLDIDIRWIGETQSIEMTNNDIQTSITIGKDSYFKEATSFFSLGIAPELIDNSTYVPAEFFNEIYGKDIFDIFTRNKITGIVNNILDTKDKKIITVNYDDSKIIFIIDENTKIIDNNTTELSPSDIKKGDKLTTVHDSKMTVTLPPQTIAYKIKIQQESNTTN